MRILALPVYFLLAVLHEVSGLALKPLEHWYGK